MNLPALDASDLYGYGHRMPDGAASALVAAAHEHQIAMLPADPDEVERCLRGLRSATIVQNEDPKEAKATMSLLRAHLSDVPLDILQDACRSYCNASGRRFFPKSAGELRTYINPLVHRRMARAFRLQQLAKQAHDEQAERDRLAADPCTPEDCAAILAEFGIGRAQPSGDASPKPARAVPTAEDYLQAVPGMTREEAEQAVADHARLLSRGRARPVGDTTTGIIESAAVAASAE